MPKKSSRLSTPDAELTAELREIANLASVAGLIGWDQETMMPEQGAALRAAQRESISRLVHQRRTSKKLGDLINAAEARAKESGNPRHLANLRALRRDYTLATKLPASLVAEITRTASLGMDAWKHARQKSDFKPFLPWLEKTIDLARQKARCYGPPASPAPDPGGGGGVTSRSGGRVTDGASRKNSPPPRHEPYDSLLDEYEPAMTAARTDAIFGPLRARLVPLIDSVARARRKPSEKPARVKVPIERQKDFTRLVCTAIGFNFNAGRMDESAHPFCDGIGPGDTRMTNRFRPDGWTDSLGTAMHESGHALYEQNLPKHSHFGQPLAEAISLGIHESQSRMWENLVGRSRPFWTWARAQAIETFGKKTVRASAEDLYKAVNIVRPGFIRVESDELTYNLHIMLRFDLERAMVNGDMKPRDLPDIWNRRIKSDLGLTVPDHRRGCLQDVHWSAGLVGYFPTYTFGNLYASQFWEAMAGDIRNRDALLAKGDFAPILKWLISNIHAHGRRYTAEELCRKITGKPLTHDPLLRHLAGKIEAVYA